MDSRMRNERVNLRALLTVGSLSFADIFILATLITTLSASVNAEIYKVVDAEGNVIYTDTPPESGAEPEDLPDILIQPATKIPVNNKIATESDKPNAISIRILRQSLHLLESPDQVQ